MTNYQTKQITPGFFLRVNPYARGFTLSDYEKTRVESLWYEYSSRNATMIHDGQIFNFVAWEGEGIVGEFVDYKFYMAQKLDPSFREKLNITPIAVSGMTVTGDKVLLGKRSEKVTQFPGYYELVPSGSIDPTANVEGRINLRKQIEVELWEETGISSTELRSVEFFALVFDEEENCYDCCAQITLNYSVISLRGASSSEEYPELRWFTKRDLRDFVESHADACVPLSLHILKQRGWLRS